MPENKTGKPERPKATKKTVRKTAKKSAKKLSKSSPLVPKKKAKASKSAKRAASGICAEARSLMESGKLTVLDAIKKLAKKWPDHTEHQLKRVCWMVAHNEREDKGAKATIWKPSKRGPSPKQ